MIQLVDTIESGMPEFRNELPTPLQEYHQFRNNLHTVDGVVINKDRVVITPSLRKDVLTALHSAHQGMSSMTSRAKASVFWPGITPAIADLQNGCNHCNRMVASRPSAPPTPPVLPVYPFQRYAPITSTTKVSTTSWWSIYTPTGLSSKGHPVVPLDWSTVCSGHSWHMAYQMNSPQTVVLNLLPRRQTGALLRCLDQMVNWTRTRSSTRYCNIATLQTRIPGYPQPYVCSVGPSRTWSRFYLASTNHTTPGAGPCRREKRLWESAIWGPLRSYRNTPNSCHPSS